MKRQKVKEPVTLHEGQRIRERINGTFMVDFNAGGERERKVFKTLDEAKTHISMKKIEVLNKGRSAFSISDQDRLDVAEIRKISEVRLHDVFSFWQKHHPQTANDMTVIDLVDAFLMADGRKGKKNIGKRRDATTLGHTKRLGAFARVYGDRPACDISTADIEQWIAVNGWQDLNRRHYVSTVRAMYAFGMRKNLVTMNPADNIELPELADREPEIMALADVEKYLKEVDSKTPEMLPREAIGFFCGLRPTELSRLDWKNVSFENRLITVNASASKTGQRRTVEISDNLVAWLAPYVQHKGRVWPFDSATTLNRKRKEARDAAGVDVPQNAGRHAFASYHLALNQDAGKTALQMGHKRDATLLTDVYRNITDMQGNPITEKAGRVYFDIMPKREESNAIEFRGAA